jgi:hypothetical protein
MVASDGTAKRGSQRVAAATGSSWVGDDGEVGQQVRGFSVLELAVVGGGEVGQGSWDRDDGLAGTGIRLGHEAVETA